ncbi:unnamed protein product [Heterobilharzia americana]|nr:unnamed protein product [Heterobilharzia americana]
MYQLTSPMESARSGYLSNVVFSINLNEKKIHIGFSLNPLLEIHSRNYPASLLNSLKLALNYPVINDDFMKDEERHKNRIINLENLHHNADNHLRKVANQMIKSNELCLRR